MATSGTFTARRGSYLNLILDWSRVQTDIANNRSKIRLTLKLQQTGYGIYFSASKSGSLHGEGFTYTGGFSGSGTRTLRTREVWINHNSDGSKSQSFSASINLNINYEGSWLGTFSVSGTANIDTIPRASSLNSFSFGTHLRNGYSNSVNLSISRASGSFTHDIQLRDGSTVIASWNGQGTPSSLSLSASQVNTLLGRMNTSTTKSFTLRVQTKNGSTNIGSAVTRNATATVDGNVVPSVSGLSVSIAGSGRDKSIGKYVQNISRAYASFSASANGGAYLVSNRIYVRKVGGANSSTIHATSGTSGAITSSGTYEAVAESIDSRNRKTTQRVTFNVEAYSTPRISVFSADRNSSVPTTVNIRRAGSHTSLGGSNLLTIKVQKRTGTQAWVDINSATTTGSASTFDASFTNTGNLVTQSYEFRLYVTDQFGNSAESIITTPTSRVVLDIHKNDGVGIGKMHERGVLDLDGDVFSNGKLYAYGGLEIAGNSWADRGEAFGGIQLNNSDILGANGIFFNDVSQANNGEGLMFLKNGATQGSTSRNDYDNLLMNDGDIILNGVRTGDLLWSGATWMNGSQTCTPSKKLSECPNGWILVWSGYTSSVSKAENWDWNYTFIHKRHIKVRAGAGIQCRIARGQTNKLAGAKYLYVHDGHFTDNNSNTEGAQDAMVLREVLAW